MVQRRLEQFQRDNARVIARYFGPEGQGSEGILQLVGRFLGMSPERRQLEWQQTRQRFWTRHRDLSQTLRRYFARLVTWLDSQSHAELASQLRDLEETDQLLMASYVTMEYAVEAAAFFNPSIVPHPSQTGVEEGGLRFIMSFRATGEGHISSVAFRSGLIDSRYRLHLDPISPYTSTPIIEPRRRYEKSLFARKLQELHASNAFIGAAITLLPEFFTRQDLETTFSSLEDVFSDAEREAGIRSMRWLAESNYTIIFDDEQDICEHVIFPVSAAESHGIEDARFVLFTDDNGERRYYATYTAFSGSSAAVQMIETTDFMTFDIVTLNGPGVRDKGMALFPRKIDGDYVMLGRQDGRTLTIGRSRHLHFWYDYATLLEPQQPWELVKIGNCGSPIETPAGWIVLTHGVGPVRRYCIGAVLLDLHNPQHIIGRLRQPLLEPLESEREGYVPNVAYTCGALRHRDLLIVPYAMSDTRSGIASCRVDELISRLLSDGP